MAEAFVIADCIVSPLGLTTDENFEQLSKNNSGIKGHNDPDLSDHFFYASLFDKKNGLLNDEGKTVYTGFERLLMEAIGTVVKNSGIDTRDNKTILIISSTKGNIGLLGPEEMNPALQKRISLHSSAKLVADHFRFIHTPIVISNACISGLLASIVGKRLIESGQYETAVIAGADIISRFILSGFQALQAISSEPCKPFDQARDGITLGEGAGAIVLSARCHTSEDIKIMGAAVGNDANHISGPSRTGEELAKVIKGAMREANTAIADIDLISAHGTATVYNDEMEAKAFTLAGLTQIPVNSLKGYYGHTLGAAGLIESIISIQSLKKGLIIPTRGFQRSDFSGPLNICDSLKKGNLQLCLKTASGFGGCNAAIVFGKS
jgi:3-oxoacyl-[acyl-carrier-protein] synthase-1